MATLQFGVDLRTDRAGRYEAYIGTAPTLELWSGALPANCAAADSGSKLAEGVLPSDWMAAASAGAVAKTGVWTVTGLAAAGAGTNAVHFRIRKTAVVHMQGDVSATAGSGALKLNNISIADTQVTTITGFTITEGNA